MQNMKFLLFTGNCGMIETRGHFTSTFNISFATSEQHIHRYTVKRIERRFLCASIYGKIRIRVTLELTYSRSTFSL